MSPLLCFLLVVVSTAYASEVTYYLYTQQTRDTPHVISNNNPNEFSNSPHFDPRRDSIFLVHGWVDSYTADFNVQVKNAILANKNVNVIVVDWSPVAGLGYGDAKDGIPAVGTTVGGFINDFNSYHGITGDQITLIGYSMGGHVVGIAGRNVNSKVKHIIGLDPAGPMYNEAEVNRLKASDGKHVQVIHTNTALFGFGPACGTVDFYPNGGSKQAGCGLDLAGGCSHKRPYQYLVEAINSGKFTATECDSYVNFQGNGCKNNRQALMGALEPDSSASGTYYLVTNVEEPFAQG